MDKPLFSIIASAIRSYLYKRCIDSICACDAKEYKYEIIFVGNELPVCKMPDNFRYIYSDATPATCLEIAARNAIGEYLIETADDLMYSDHFLDKVYGYVQILDDNILISFRYYLPELDEIADRGMVYDMRDDISPFIGVAPVFRRDIWNKLGGLDKRFHGSLADMDMQMRFYEHGMVPFMTPDCIVTEDISMTRHAKKASLLYSTGKQAKKTIDSLWKKKKGSTSNTRLSPVQSFDDNLI